MNGIREVSTGTGAAIVRLATDESLITAPTLKNQSMFKEINMSRGINKVILVGNLGRDPEIRYTPDGSAIANVTIATSASWKDRQTGEQQEKTEWHRVVFFSRLAEIVGEYLRKGSQVYIEGRLQTRKWQDQSGQDRYITEVVANEMQMLGSRARDLEASPSNDYQQPRQTEKPATAPDTAPSADANDFDDDIPF